MPAEPAAVEPSRWERGEESLAEKFSSGLYAGSVLEGGEVDPRADKGAWRSMGPKELQSILAGKMSGGAANAGKKGHYYSWFPSYSAAIKGKKGKPKFLVEFAGQASEDETTVTPVGRADISGVWVSEGGEWRKITPQALETEYGFSAPALARQEPTAAPAAATGFLSILTTEEQDEAERLKREIAHDMRSPQAVGGVPPFIGKAVRLAYLYAKAGVKTLADMTERLVADFGEGIRPHVAAIWNAMNQPVAAKAPETETTALMRAVLEEDAAAHGEEMPGRRPPVSLDEMVAQANAAFVADPFVGQRLVDELESTQRPSIPADRAILLHERTRLINEEKALTLQRTEAQQRNDTAALARIKVQSDRLAEQRRRLFDVATAGIRDPGLMLRFQQLFMAMDYTSAEDQIARIEVSQGRPATEAQKTKAREQAQKVADLNKQLEEANARAERWYKEALAAKAEKPAKPKAGEPARRTRAPVKPTIFTDEAAAAAVVRLRTKFRRVSAGIDPTIAADLLIIGGNTFERGARTFGRWAKQVLAELAELGPGAADAARPYLQDVWTTLQKRMAAEGKQDKAKVAYLKRTTARLTELEQKLAAGETEKPVKPPPRPLSEEELAVKEALDLVKWKMDQARMAPADRFWEGFRSVGRALRFPAGGDVSIPGRQTKPLLWNEIGGLLSFKPSKVWLTSTAKGWGAFFSRGKVLAMMEQLSADKPEAVAFAKEFVMWEELGRDPAKRPETGLSPFMERYMPLVRRGNEAAVAANNYAVVGAYELFAPRFRARGKLETPADRRALAKEIGKLTGRAVLPRGENVRRIAALLRDYAWSPRFWWAKITNVATLFGTLSLNPAVRAEGLRTLAGAVVYQTGMAALSMMLGGKFSLDPDDPDFMMAVFGNTKLDFTGGLRTPIRLAIRTAVSFFYDIMDGEAKGEDRGELILRHLKAQEGPLAGLITTIWTGKTFFGEEIHPPWSAEGWGDWTEEAKNRAMFMWLNDAYEVFRDELKNNGMTDAVFKAVAFGALSFSGENVQTYERKPKGKAPPFNPAEN
ncbi:MAG: hypothetical protein IMZ62_01460 [Chloroflexi bacterium]|nr:hypothetical protein [Chloroflexota bacterium]